MLKIRLIALNIAAGLLVFFVLCLGSQNLTKKERLNLGFGSTAPLPTGFLVGVSIVIGIISGGSSASLIILPPGRD